MHSVRSAEFEQCRLSAVQSVVPTGGALVVSTLFPSSDKVLSIQFPSEVKLSPSRPKWLPSCGQMVPSGRHLRHKVATRCVE